jgi:hypothetical protein
VRETAASMSPRETAPSIVAKAADARLQPLSVPTNPNNELEAVIPGWYYWHSTHSNARDPFAFGEGSERKNFVVDRAHCAVVCA